MAKVSKPVKNFATSVKLAPATKAALDKAAKADKRSVSSLLQKIISDWLESEGHLKS